jgi:hypothetical protein
MAVKFAFYGNDIGVKYNFINFPRWYTINKIHNHLKSTFTYVSIFFLS